jgi:hypothetical protein
MQILDLRLSKEIIGRFRHEKNPPYLFDRLPEGQHRF